MGSENQNDPFFVSEIYFFEIPQWRTEIHRAHSWDLTDYGTAKISLYATSECICTLKFNVKGEEFGESRIFQYPSSALQPVVDSNRYFVLKILWTQIDKVEDIGICFYDRKQSKEFLSLLQYHLPTTEETRYLKEETESSRSGSSNSIESNIKTVVPSSTKDNGISSSIETDLEELQSRFSSLSTSNTVKETPKQTSVVSEPFVLTATTTTTTIETGLEEFRRRLSISSPPNTETQKQTSVVSQPFVTTTTTTIEKTNPKENSISVTHQTTPVIRRTRVNFQTRIIKEDVDENIVFFDNHYPAFRIITNNYSKIDSDTLKKLRNLAPKQLIRPGLKKKHEA